MKPGGYMPHSQGLSNNPYPEPNYSKDLTLEILSLDYVKLLGYFLFYFSTGLIVCYSFRPPFWLRTLPISIF